MKVAYQGEPGAYSEEAGYVYFESPEMVSFESFEDVFSAVTLDTCQSGLVMARRTFMRTSTVMHKLPLTSMSLPWICRRTNMVTSIT